MIGRMRALLLSSALLAASPMAHASSGDASLIFVGDIMVAETPGELISRGEDPFQPFAALLSSHDVRIGNLECVVATTGTAEEKPYTFRADPRTLPVLKRHFDAVSLANNHSGDFGKAAFAEQLALMDTAGLPYFGGGRDATAAHAPWIVERNGVRIALLGYVEFKPRSFEADASRPGVAWSGEDDDVIEDIIAARRVHRADIVIPFMHWGWEDEPDPSPRLRAFARRMIDAGADLVVGGHPHVTQGAEYYRGKPIIYSLGNFVFDGFEDFAPARRGWLLRRTVDAQGVRDWDTVQADIDLQGTPHPDLQAWTPCGQRGVGTVLRCQAGAQR